MSAKQGRETHHASNQDLQEIRACDGIAMVVNEDNIHDVLCELTETTTNPNQLELIFN